MRVDREHHLFDGRFQLNRRDALRDDLGRIRPDDVDPEDLAILRIGNDFDKAVMRIDDRRLGVADERELADLHLVSLLLGLRLGEADAGNLRIGVGAAWDARAIDRLGVLPGDLRRNNQASHRADVSQLRQAADDIAGSRRIPGSGRLHPLVRHDEAAIRRDLHLVETNVVRTRRTPHSHQNLLRLLALRLAVRVGPGDEHAILVLLNLCVLDREIDIDSALLEETQQLLADLFVLSRHNSRQHFEDGDLGAEALEDGGELHTHRTRADYDQRRRHARGLQNFVVGHDRLIRLVTGQHTSVRSHRQHDLLFAFTVSALPSASLEASME